MIKKIVTGILLASVIAISPALAVDTDSDPDAFKKGREIAIEADNRDKGFGDNRADLEMILKNRHGEESTRKLRNRTKEVPGDGDMLFVFFEEPRDVYGTAFLSHTHVEGQDDQWIFLPALRRVKRISSNNKSGPFVGSEFAYEDLVSQEVDKYTHRYLRDETVNGEDCFVIEQTPTYEHSGYTKLIAWIDKTHYRLMKVHYFDRKGEHMKTLTFGNYKQYLDKYWRSNRMHMDNHLTGKSTTLLFKNYAFQNGFTDRDFDQSSLKRAR